MHASHRDMTGREGGEYYNSIAGLVRSLTCLRLACIEERVRWRFETHLAWTARLIQSIARETMFGDADVQRYNGDTFKHNP